MVGSQFLPYPGSDLEKKYLAHKIIRVVGTTPSEGITPYRLWISIEALA